MMVRGEHGRVGKGAERAVPTLVWRMQDVGTRLRRFAHPTE